MNQEELRQQLIELLLTDVECDKDEHGDCSMCEYRYSDDNCYKYYSGVMTDFLIANDVTIRKRGEWQFREKEAFWIDDIEEIEKTGKPTKRKLPFCPFCKAKFGSIAQDYSFCPHCGADMRGMKGC